ncbi:hypothetical protein [Phytoactinopolyspora endophytica]|uniref:hypothetical protein n=1 Tax=Phytoactinopolyspora endophytica TaxID=1642495 RepID=UPI00101C2127|nr:hypothetical protein [Phytoactinopolyspora endophytica]
MRIHRAATAIVTVALACGLTACGDDDSSDDGGTPNAEGTPSGDGSPTVSDSPTPDDMPTSSDMPTASGSPTSGDTPPDVDAGSNEEYCGYLSVTNMTLIDLDRSDVDSLQEALDGFVEIEAVAPPEIKADWGWLIDLYESGIAAGGDLDYANDDDERYDITRRLNAHANDICGIDLGEGGVPTPK